ncbi:tRNA (adenosine(37)-N6)-dimethylallyltransferase MiaA [Desulfatiferula olefinivorans]
MDKPNIIVVCGPTGIGKTAAAIGLCKALGGRIINADSMQIYRFMDIGTAKPTADERAQVPHDLVDIVNPDEPYDAARFAGDADACIRALWAAGIVPVVAGGTGLYIKALVGGLFRARPADPAVLARLEKACREQGAGMLHDRLKTLDPEAACRIHPNDAFRIIRALEIFETTGRPISDYQAAHGFADRPYRVLTLGLAMDRERLYERINRRVDLMIEAGFVDEVKGLLARGYSPTLKSMGSLGYRHIIAWLGGRETWDETLRLLKRDTRRYAKRQMTWFRADPAVEWFDPGDPDAMIRRCRTFLGRS